MPSYTPITSLKHPDVAEARRRLAERDAAGEAGHCLAEGGGFAMQALQAGALVERIFLLEGVESAERRALTEAGAARAVPTSILSKGVFFKLLGLGYETSVDVLALVRRRPLDRDDLLETAARPDALLMIGERIQDPRNIGVMLRNADGMGVGAAVFSAQSGALFSRETVRSSTGSIFRMPTHSTGDLPGLLRLLRERGVRVVATSAAAEIDFREADYRRPCAVVFGNETSGLSEEARAHCDAFVRIPMQGGAHSFNVTVACGIVLCEAARRRD